MDHNTTVHPPHTDHVHSDDSHHHSHDHASEGHAMKMWFHGGCQEVIIFDFWRTESCWGLVLSCFIIFAMAAAYESVKWVRLFLQGLAITRQRHPVPTVCTDSQSGVLIEKEPSNNATATLRNDEIYRSTVTREVRTRSGRLERVLRGINFKDQSPYSTFRLLQSGLYMVQLTLAYWLMLIVMTYNVYFTVAVVTGAGFGHWLFALSKKLPMCAQKDDAFASDACH